MSDPAFASSPDTSSYMSVEDMPRDPDAIYLFDFDGVIATGVEDHIYKLEERPDERNRLAELETSLGLRINDMEFRYRRHLVFQELALKQKLPIAPGAGYALAKWASENARFFVLTARSGWAATARVRLFLQEHGLRPIDIYQVGRVYKDRQILRTTEEFPDALVYYIEDSSAHLERAAQLQSARLRPVYCEAKVSLNDVKELYSTVFEKEVSDAGRRRPQR